MKAPIDYNEYIRRLYQDKNPHISSCRNVTFVVTEACDLRCVYCYETHKCAKYMTFDVAKKIVDLIFKLSETDESSFINTQTQAVILDFIGGEPLLNIKVIAQTCDYFWRKAIELKHRWADTFRISMISNGVNYFKPEVQEFIKKYRNKLSFGITIEEEVGKKQTQHRYISMLTTEATLALK